MQIAPLVSLSVIGLSRGSFNPRPTCGVFGTKLCRGQGTAQVVERAADTFSLRISNQRSPDTPDLSLPANHPPNLHSDALESELSELGDLDDDPREEVRDLVKKKKSCTCTKDVVDG